MKNIPFLAVSWLLISCLIMFGMLTMPQGIEAGTPGEESVFTISGITISPTEANTGQDITISATIEETSNNSGIYLGTLRINGTVEEIQSLFIAPLGSEQITFTISKGEAGEYSVDLDGLEGSFSVIGDPVSDSSDLSFPTVGVVIGIIVAVVIVGLLVFYLNKRAYGGG
jgi:hypothetical protein